MRAPQYIAFCGLMSLTSGLGASQDALPQDLTELSLEALLDIEVTTVSKQAETLADAPAAVYVLQVEDILRSGARTIPEALRLVPGLHVARVDGQRWAITARGFNGIVADKLEVLIDGRSIYSPLFSGVFWDAQDVFIPDLERIEVIRGPAATLWGSNAVNGVINIVTKQAQSTQGVSAYAGGGDELKAFAGLRYGGSLRSDLAYRLHLRHWDRDAALTADGERASDAMQMTHAGLRTDWTPNQADSYTLVANGYQNRLQNVDPALNPEGQDNEQSGANLLTRWSRLLSGGSEISVQFYWDHSERTQVGSFGEIRDTWDVQFQHAFSLGESHRLVWGAGYRLTQDEQDNPPLIVFTPAERTVHSAHAFLSDEIRISEATALTLNARIEDNEYSDVDVQPSLRLRHSPDDKTTLWAAASRALRLPNRLDTDVLVPIPDFGVQGNPDFEPEEAWTYELGLRRAVNSSLSLDATVFYSDYDKLRGVEPAAAPNFPLIVNNYSAQASGLELSSRWQPHTTLELSLAYAYFDLRLQPKGQTADTQTRAAENQAPRHQAWVRWHWQALQHTDLGGHLRFVDALPDFDLDSYTELDLRIAQTLRPGLRLALTGHNLLQDKHREWDTESAVERSILLELIWTPGER